MKAQAERKSHLPKGRFAMSASPLALLVVFGGLLHAAPGNDNGNGGGNATPAPPIPYVESLECLVPGVTRDLLILGQVTTNEAFVNKKGNTFISGSFSDPGVTINSITVNSATSLTLNVTVAPDASLTTSTLTITNPDGPSATSIGAVACVTDVPIIEAAEITPEPPSVVDDITAVVEEVTSEENTFPVTFEYQWYENGVAIAQTASTLPAAATVQNRSYYCEITPIKAGSIRGNASNTPAVLVSADADGNGIHDAWENQILSAVGADPNADPDGDGLTNLTEYLFGLDPNDANSNKAIVRTLDPATGEFEYSRPVDKIEGVTYRVETSTDLVNWTQQTGASQSLSSASANSEVITVGLPPALINANSKLFVRISVE